MFEGENLREMEFNSCATVESSGGVATGCMNHSHHRTAPVSNKVNMPAKSIKQTCNKQLIN